MLPQQNRLPATQKLHNPKFRRTPLFSVKIAKNDLTLCRFGFVVRKSVDKRAVVRNRIRRVFRSCIEESLNNIVVGHDMLFFLEKGIMDKSRDEVFQKLRLLLTEEHLL
jgi:ribonuclease P protein component